MSDTAPRRLGGFRLYAKPSTHQPNAALTPGNNNNNNHHHVNRRRGGGLAVLGPVAVLALFGLAWSGRQGAPTVERGGKHAVVNKLVTHLSSTSSSMPKVDARQDEDPSFQPFARRGSDDDGAKGGAGGLHSAGSRSSASAPRGNNNNNNNNNNNDVNVNDNDATAVDESSHPVSRDEPVLLEAIDDSSRRLRRDVVAVDGVASTRKVQEEEVEEVEEEEGNENLDGRRKNGASGRSGHQNHHHHHHHRRHGGHGRGHGGEGHDAHRHGSSTRLNDDHDQPGSSSSSSSVAAAASASAASSSTTPTVGFFLQMAHEPKASLEVVRSIRKHYPRAPLTVVSDAGWDCAGLCKKYSCKFRREPKPAGMHGRGGTTEWIRRLRDAALWSDATWLVVLEDDVRVDGPITRWPPSHVDAGGVEDHRWTAPLKPALLREIAKRAEGKRPSYEHYGLCGGAILRASALLEAPELTPADLGVMRGLDDRVGKWNDVALTTTLMAAGRVVKPWGDVKQGNHPPHRTAFVHNDKRWYGKRLAEKEEWMCTPPPPTSR